MITSRFSLSWVLMFSAATSIASAATTLPTPYTLHVQLVRDNIVHVWTAKDDTPPKSLAVIAGPGNVRTNELDNGGHRLITTSKLQITVAADRVSFADENGKPLLAETTRSIEPVLVQGLRTNHVRQQWAENDDESLFGLGQHQLGLVNIKGYDLDLWQHNGTVAVPMLVSSRGYGVLWDNPSYTRFGDLRQFELPKAEQLLDVDGKPGGLTATYFADGHFGKAVSTRTEARVDVLMKPDAPSDTMWAGQGQWQGEALGVNQRLNSALPANGDISVRWEGFVVPSETGAFQFQTFSNSGIKLWIDGQLVIDHWRQGWLPWFDVARTNLTSGKKHAIKLEWSKDQGDQVRLMWKSPSKETGTSLWSEVGDGVNYYFINGGDADGVIQGYRELTGTAPLPPKWALGLWQSRQRYETADQILGVVKKFRDLKIPFDNIVLDWFYWKADQWGTHEFDPKRFPDPSAMIQSVHDLNARFMISVWPKFYPGNEHFEQMRSRGFLYERTLAEETKDWVGYPYAFYDTLNPEAGKLFWKQMNETLFPRKIDAWWLDATEPDLMPKPTLNGQRTAAHPTALGPGTVALNAFPLMNAKAVYEGQREAAPDQRVFILTRSGFLGQQRYGAATWSGDISATWTAMKKQIAAGIGSCASGLPYWSMDSGGFSVPAKFASKKPTAEATDEWRELNTRWFEFATFVPLLRAHGEFPLREMWEFGGTDSPAFAAQLKFDRLRYRLLPYLYSLAGDVTHNGGTMMRGLFFDFPNDATARDCVDQFMLGKSLMVSPVTEYQARSRKVYLPGGTWYELWTGKSVSGNNVVDSAAPFDVIPVHVRAGSILPMGPDVQYTTEKTSEPIKLFVYGGADGHFTLYEDDGLSYQYEKGAFSKIEMTWDDAQQTLRIAPRVGQYPGMLEARTFQVVLVNANKPVAFDAQSAIDRTVHYTGQAVEITLSQK